MISDVSNISDRTAILSTLLAQNKQVPRVGLLELIATHFSSGRIWGSQFTLKDRAILSKYASSSAADGL